MPDCSFIKPGYSFQGWSKTTLGEVEYLDKEENISGLDGITTLYAVWKKENVDLSSYSLDNTYVNRVYEGTIFNSYLGNLQLQNGYTASIIGRNGIKQDNSTYIGTGSITKIFINNKLYLSKINIVKGDVTGDGSVNIADVKKIADYTLSGTGLEYYDLSAAEVTNNNTINIADVKRIADYSLNKEEDLWK